MDDRSSRSDDRVPVTVITGYLGAGKTTLINRILGEITGKQFAIIVNEFGDIGIDGELIRAGEEELIELSSGCICCVVRGDLIQSLRKLLAERSGVSGIIIETTGLANPSPVIQTLVVDQVIGTQCRLDSVICVVDAVHILDQLTKGRDASDQISFSDYLLLNKAGDATERLEEIETRLRQLNPFAIITRVNHSNISVADVLNRYSFDLDRIEVQLEPIANHHDHSHIDDTGITSVSLRCDTELDSEQLEDWLRNLLARRGTDILRTKGIFCVRGEERKLVVQAVNMMLEGDFIGSWGDEPRQSHLVFIGRRLNRDSLNTGFHNCHAAMPAPAE